jgi:signal transduction histidine kinase
LLFTPTEYPLNNLIEQVVYDFENLAEVKGITIRTDLKKQTVHTDIESLKIILRNLIDNAIKYTNPNGAISIQCGRHDNYFCYISIEDNGIGIKPEILEKINGLKELSIDKIDRAKGIGLGMILCQTLIDKNKGSILIESSLDTGTKITILLPKKNI